MILHWNLESWKSHWTKLACERSSNLSPQAWALEVPFDCQQMSLWKVHLKPCVLCHCAWLFLARMDADCVMHSVRRFHSHTDHKHDPGWDEEVSKIYTEYTRHRKEFWTKCSFAERFFFERANRLFALPWAIGQGQESFEWKVSCSLYCKWPWWVYYPLLESSHSCI